jgi:hypothetical protein
MNTQPNQEKRTIKVKEFLEYFHNGLSDELILEKYNLTQAGLDKFFGMLVERGILEQHEIDIRQEKEIEFDDADAQAMSEKTSYICPSCLASYDELFDICPSCGISFQELINKETLQHKDEPEIEKTLDEEPCDPKTSCPVLSCEAFIATPVPTPKDDFLDSYDLKKEQSLLDDPIDQVISGLPLDLEEEPAKEPVVFCDQCQEEMKPGLRDIYETDRSKLAFKVTFVCLILAFLGITALNFMENASVIRSFILFGTVSAFMFAGVMSAIGSFMYLARERVYYCSYCGKLYPRG